MAKGGSLRRALRRADRAVYGAFLILVSGLLAFGLGRSVMEPQLGLRMARLIDGGVATAQAAPLRVSLPAELLVPASPAPERPLYAGLPGLTGVAAARLETERGCLALAVYYESRGETLQGQRAVAEVVLRRARLPDYPPSVCGVVLQGMQRRTGCQFSFTCDGSLRRGKSMAQWREAVRVADYMAEGAGRRLNLTGRATHFHAVTITPYWADDLVETVTIGNHVFYRLPSRTERIARLDVGAAKETRTARN